MKSQPKILNGTNQGKLAQITALILSLVLAGVGGCYQNPASAGRPNILLITVEAMRPDHMSAYGSERTTTPFLDALAQKGILFRNCVAPSSWTRPSMASLLSGVSPRRHGVVTVRHKVDGHGEPTAIPEDLLVLAEVLRGNGYRTIGVSSNFNCGENSGADQGFEVYLEEHEASARRLQELLQDPEVTAITNDNHPYFLWVHYFDPHAPYFPQQPWAKTYLGPDTIELAQALADTFDQNPLNLLPQIKEHPEYLPIYQGCYDSEIRYADEYIRNLIADLDPQGNALIIVTSDHGEMFMEHQGVLHSQTLFGEVTNIPLIITGPGNLPVGIEVSSRVGLIDVFPTILDYLGITPPSGLDGESLLPYLEDPGDQAPRAIISELNYEKLRLESICLDNWKLIQKVDKNSTENQYLYNLARDQAEMNNLLSKEPEHAARLGEVLKKWRRDVVPHQSKTAKKREWKKGELKSLRTLGYIN